MTCRFGDCRDSMRAMIAEGVRVQTCVTSPPYWGLRDYGVDGQLGLEATPDEYVSNMVEVFGLVRELLADDGTLWLNLGDSYAGGNTLGRNDADRNFTGGGGNKGGSGNPGKQGEHERITGLKPKDLVGIPWRVAFALQADGWYLRSDIIWAKPNPMPESVTDRPTKAHEYMFLLAKRERYYYDADAIREDLAPWNPKYGREGLPPDVGSRGGNFNVDAPDGVSRIRSAQGSVNVKFRDRSIGRNRRTVWTVATEPYSEAHFATFPTALIEPCILAGSRVGDTVFDPFLGSGTTAQVAQDLGRKWLGCELNDNYGKLQHRRTEQMGLELCA